MDGKGERGCNMESRPVIYKQQDGQIWQTGLPHEKGSPDLKPIRR